MCIIITLCSKLLKQRFLISYLYDGILSYDCVLVEETLENNPIAVYLNMCVLAASFFRFQ